ncbi:hypothetical protein [Chelatococcus reniformis]|uniref:Nitrate reductase n=1 Tax=Chelatococcus reniformis TaxID=1494448 RepID=A0A916U913_9HYPH|nr:hypothetical protein [Chelatococcus reniformis]GGC63650.1 hypothetical protein GCM10010994_22770 [Chelatococcus reniformis]
MAFGLLKRRPRPDAEIVARIKDWTRTALGADEAVHFAVNEIVCHDPGCPGTETVILVMQPGRRTWALKVAKAMDETTEHDVAAAMAEARPA